MTSGMVGATHRGLRLSATAVAALLLCFAVGGAVAIEAHAGGVRIYKGGSKKDRRAKLLLKVKTAGKGVPRKVAVLKLTGATASCAIGPNEGEFSPRRFSWRFPYALPVTLLENAKGRKVRSFEGVQTNGGAPTGGEEEEFAVTGGFSRNRRSASVSIDREYTVKGSAVESSEELVTCTYNARFKVKLKRR